MGIDRRSTNTRNSADDPAAAIRVTTPDDWKIAVIALLPCRRGHNWPSARPIGKLTPKLSGATQHHGGHFIHDASARTHVRRHHKSLRYVVRRPLPELPRLDYAAVIAGAS